MPGSPERHSSAESRTGAVTESRTNHEALKRPELKPRSLESERHEANAARHEALKEAVDKEKYAPAKTTAETEPIGSSVASRARLKQSFDKTMGNVRGELPLHQKIFSKIIHSPAIEKTSDVVASTVARPDAILSGSICALVFTAALYFTARYFGFSLSGAETIAAFIAGWLIGILFDIIRGTLRGRR